MGNQAVSDGGARNGKRRRGKYGFARHRKPRLYGALDLGTNNCRLLIARPTGQGFRVIASFSKIVRLGEGLNDQGFLSEEAMSRTISALSICSEKLKAFDVTRTRNIATEACRRAANCDGFLSQIEQDTGLNFETITSHEEARLALKGCQNLIGDHIKHALVFDIGGGSTEIVWAHRSEANGGREFNITDVISLPLGVVTLAEAHEGEEISSSLYEKMVTDIGAQLDGFCNKNDIKEKVASGDVHMLGTSGTVTTLGAVHLNLPQYDRSKIDGLRISFEELGKASQNLTGLNYQDRSAIPCIGAERAELVVPGCAILEAICKTWPVGQLRIADRGLREGMLLELMAEDGIQVTGNPAANSLQTEHANQVNETGSNGTPSIGTP